MTDNFTGPPVVRAELSDVMRALAGGAPAHQIDPSPVGANCVEIDAATWAQHHQRRSGHDWSAEPSSRDLSEVRAGALEAARDFLRGSSESAAADLAKASDHDLVRRLGLCDDQGRLVNAGALLLCAGPAVIDYRRREVAGGDAVTRVQVSGRSLLEQLSYVIDAVRIHKPADRARPGMGAGEGEPGAGPRR